MGSDAASEYHAKTAHELSIFSRQMQRAGHPSPLGNPASGAMVVVEQPVGPRLLDALARSLQTVNLSDAYATYASTGLLLQEVLSIEPQLLVAVGPGAAREIDAMEHPLARESFSETPEGVLFSWKKGTTGLRLPSLAPALQDEEAKRRFWRSFLTLRSLASKPRS